VYVLCAGFYNDFANPNDDTPAKIYVLQPDFETVVDSIVLGEHAFKMAIGSDGHAYVPITDSVLVVDTRLRKVNGTFVRGVFYGVGVDEISGNVYLSDPKNYQQPGTVFIYDSQKTLLRQFDAGIIPGSFAFRR
jgi:DNA-binding beta-propeller fold protein YncE